MVASVIAAHPLSVLRGLIAAHIASAGSGVLLMDGPAGTVRSLARVGSDLVGSSVPAPDDDPEQERMAALLSLAQQGDGEAFGQIYDHHMDGVYRYLYYRVGSHSLAEDLTSETFLKALQRLDSFTWRGRDIRAWFITIARNLVTDYYRSSRYSLEVMTADMLDADHGDDGIEGQVLDRLGDDELIAAIRRLKPDQQECVALRFLQGLSVAETSAVMQRSQGAVKQLQLRAIRALAKSLSAVTL